MIVSKYAPKIYPLLRGTFPIYKPAGTSIMSILHELQARLLQVVGLQAEGKEKLKELKKLNMPRRYLAKGRFGMATVSHGLDSKVVDRSTWDHITAEQVDRVLTVLQGVHRNAAIKSSGVELDSQQAYKLASRGLLKPNVPTEAVVLDCKLLSFKPPDFSIEVTCINESCYFVRRVIHMLGYELKSTAVCTHLQRQADGVFMYSDPHTLLGRQINANNVVKSIEHCEKLLGKTVLKRKDNFERVMLDMKDAQLPITSEECDGALLNVGCAS